MDRNKRRKPFFNIVDLLWVSLLFAGSYWFRHHRTPHKDEWQVALIVWFVFYSVLGGYRKIVAEMERQNELLELVLMRLGGEEPDEHDA